MTREPPLNWVGVTLASSAPWVVSKTSLATLSPSWTKHAPITVRIAVTRSNAPWLAAISDAEHDRDDRRRQERQAGRAQGQPAERQARLDRRAALRRERVEVAPRLADRPLRVLEERDLGLVPAPRRWPGSESTAPRRSPRRPQTVTWRRSS